MDKVKFTSYAQNFEDIMLWRSLKNVKNGFYIDVGAQDPNKHSVTKSFYERGWRGINIEPVPSCHKKLIKERSEDCNLEIAASNEEGTIIIHELVDTGLSTVNSAHAKKHVKKGFEEKMYEVKTKTLDVICEENSVKEVHFLKIDVEGAEKSVLEGFSFKKIRPWIVLVEATEPMTQNDISQEWDSLLTKKQYDMVHFDGLNRFYVAGERCELKKSFKSPVNIFDSTEIQLSDDHWIVYHNVSQKNRKIEELSLLNMKKDTLNIDKTKEITEMNSIIENQEELIKDLNDQLNLTLRSLSWSATLPFRVAKRLFHKIRHNPQEVISYVHHILAISYRKLFKK